ncbi:ABC transporter substrate-binding protein [Mycobacterium sp. C31M]
MTVHLDRRGFLGLSAVMLGSGLLVACGTPGGQAPGSSPAGPTGDPVRGGTLTFSDTEAVTSWQAQKLSTYSAGNLTFHTNVFLLYFDPYQKQLQPWVAQSWTKNDENTRFSFTIRKGITFSDGTPLTPEIVAQNYDVYGRGNEALRIPVHQQLSRGFDHVEVDGDTVTVVLNKPNQQFLVDTTRLNSPILGARTLALDLEEAGRPENHVGAGPFVFKSQVPNQSAVLARRPGYQWAPPSSANQGEAYLDEIVWKVLPESGLRTGALQSNQVDVARGIQPSDEAAIQAAGYQLLLYRPPLGTSNYAGLRVDNEFTKDPLVRRALVLGIDREGLSRDALSPSYPPPISILNSNNANVVDLAGEFTYNPDHARDLLSQAGWTQGSDGIRAKGGTQLHLTVPQSAQQVALGPAWEYIAQQWRKELGVVLDVRNDPSFAAAANKDVTVPLVVSRTSIISLGQSFGGPGNTALLGSPPELASLYTRELEAADDAEFKAVQIEQQKALIKGSYVIAYFEEAQTFGASPDVHVSFQTQTYPDFYNAWKKP